MLQRRSPFQECRLAGVAVDLRHLELALGDSARLVQKHRVRAHQGLQAVAALDEDPSRRRPPNTAKVTQRHRNYQGARAGHDQKDRCPVQPCRPAVPGNQRRHNRDEGCDQDDRRCINLCEARNEPLRAGLFIRSRLNQLKNSADGRRLIIRTRPNPEHTGLIDAAAEDRRTRRDFQRKGFTGDG